LDLDDQFLGARVNNLDVGRSLRLFDPLCDCNGVSAATIPSQSSITSARVISSKRRLARHWLTVVLGFQSQFLRREKIFLAHALPCLVKPFRSKAEIPACESLGAGGIARHQ
jgi:hypothetical protein